MGDDLLDAYLRMAVNAGEELIYMDDYILRYLKNHTPCHVKIKPREKARKVSDDGEEVEENSLLIGRSNLF